MRGREYWMLVVVVAVVALTVALFRHPHMGPAAGPSTDAVHPTVAVTRVPSSRATYTSAPPVGALSDYTGVEAVVKTTRGSFVMIFYPAEAPKTVASFVQLSRDGFYNGLTFHRVVPGFVVQGGDPTGTGAGGPGFTLPAEFNTHKHTVGAVAMARTQDPNSAGSQFYICLGPAPFLDGQYTVFGQVVSGMDVVQKIQKGDHIESITIQPKPVESSTEQRFSASIEHRCAHYKYETLPRSRLANRD
jgi:peptidylprolyl isomerase/peptidyl-prolyl cis-trans isomerase B (cyclophilin B)